MDLSELHTTLRVQRTATAVSSGDLRVKLEQMSENGEDGREQVPRRRVPGRPALRPNVVKTIRPLSMEPRRQRLPDACATPKIQGCIDRWYRELHRVGADPNMRAKTIVRDRAPAARRRGSIESVAMGAGCGR